MKYKVLFSGKKKTPRNANKQFLLDTPTQKPKQTMGCKDKHMDKQCENSIHTHRTNKSLQGVYIIGKILQNVVC